MVEPTPTPVEAVFQRNKRHKPVNACKHDKPTEFFLIRYCHDKLQNDLITTSNARKNQTSFCHPTSPPVSYALHLTTFRLNLQDPLCVRRDAIHSTVQAKGTTMPLPRRKEGSCEARNDMLHIEHLYMNNLIGLEHINIYLVPLFWVSHLNKYYWSNPRKSQLHRASNCRLLRHQALRLDLRRKPTGLSWSRRWKYKQSVYSQK